MDWEVIMLLGLKELRCQYCFIKDGIEKRGHPSIIYAPEDSDEESDSSDSSQEEW